MKLIVLLIYFVAVIFVLYLDSYRNTHRRSLFLPMLWLFIMLSRSIGLWLNPAITGSAGAIEEGNPVNRYFFTFMIMSGIIILAFRKIAWSNILRENKWLVILFVYHLISIIWSEFPGIAFKRYFRAIGDPVFALLIITSGKPSNVICNIYRRSMYLLVPLSIIFIKYFPLLGRSYHRYTGEMSITGVATDKNGLASSCLIFVIIIIFQYIQDIKNGKIHNHRLLAAVDACYLFMTLWLLVKADSATAMTCVLAGVSIMIGFYLIKNWRSIILILYAFVIAAISATPLLMISEIQIFKSVVNTIGHTDTFWGRVTNWFEFISLMNAPSMIGTGFRSYWLGERLISLWDKFWWHPNEAHNGYIEAFLEGGYIAVFIIVIIILLTTSKIKDVLTYDFDSGVFLSAMLSIVLLYNITEAGFLHYHKIWFVFMLTILSTTRIFYNHYENS